MADDSKENVTLDVNVDTSKAKKELARLHQSIDASAKTIAKSFDTGDTSAKKLNTTLKSTTKVVKKLDDGSDDLSLDDSLKVSNNSAKKLNDTLDQTGKKIDTVKKSKPGESLATSFAKGITAASLLQKGVGLIISGIKDAILSFIEFEKGFSSVVTLLDLSTPVEQINQLKQGVLDLGVESGQSFDTLNTALFDLISGGVQAADAIDVLRVATKLAAAGATTVDNASKALVATTTAFGKEAGTALEIAEKFFLAQKRGVTDVEKLSKEFNKVAGLGKSLGLSFDEVLAASTALTADGAKPTSEAFTQMKSVMSAVILAQNKLAKESPAVQKALSLQNVKSVGLVQALNELKTATGGNIPEIQKLLGGSEALAATLSLTGAQSELFGQIMTDMGDDAKRTATFQSALETKTETLGTSIDRAKNAAIAFGNGLVEKLTPFLIPIIDFITKLVSGLDSTKEATDEVGGSLEKNSSTFNSLKNIVGEFVSVFKSVFAALKSFVAALIAIEKETQIFSKSFQIVATVVETVVKLALTPLKLLLSTTISVYDAITSIVGDSGKTQVELEAAKAQAIVEENKKATKAATEEEKKKQAELEKLKIEESKRELDRKKKLNDQLLIEERGARERELNLAIKNEAEKILIASDGAEKFLDGQEDRAKRARALAQTELELLSLRESGASAESIAQKEKQRQKLEKIDGAANRNLILSQKKNISTLEKIEIQKNKALVKLEQKSLDTLLESWDDYGEDLGETVSEFNAETSTLVEDDFAEKREDLAENLEKVSEIYNSKSQPGSFPSQISDLEKALKKQNDILNSTSKPGSYPSQLNSLRNFLTGQKSQTSAAYTEHLEKEEVFNAEREEQRVAGLAAIGQSEAAARAENNEAAISDQQQLFTDLDGLEKPDITVTTTLDLSELDETHEIALKATSLDLTSVDPATLQSVSTANFTDATFDDADFNYPAAPGSDPIVVADPNTAQIVPSQNINVRPTSTTNTTTTSNDQTIGVEISIKQDAVKFISAEQKRMETLGTLSRP